jgi:hypothetical protein
MRTLRNGTPATITFQFDSMAVELRIRREMVKEKRTLGTGNGVVWLGLNKTLIMT